MIVNPQQISTTLTGGSQYAGDSSKHPAKTCKRLGTLGRLQINWVFGAQIPEAFPMVISSITPQQRPSWSPYILWLVF